MNYGRIFRMVRIVFLILFLIIPFSVAITSQILEGSSPEISKIEIKGPIQPSTSRFIKRAIGLAENKDSVALLIVIDTPGGMLEPTRDIVRDIMNSKIPVVSYVHPSGARAASAGTFVMAASHVAAMAPGTHLGAAAPINKDGNDLSETLKSKVIQDTTALLRSAASRTGKNAEALESTVTESSSYTSEEALEVGIINFISPDIRSLLDDLHGENILLDGTEIFVDTKDATLKSIERSFLERFLDAIGNPNITFVLLTLGSIGLIVEFVKPGILIGGFTGVLALSLAFVGLGQLPVSWLGLSLMAVAMVLFIAEAQAPGLGILIIGGLICFVLGSFLLFGRISPPPIGGPNFNVNFWILGFTTLILGSSVLLCLKAFKEAAGPSIPSHSGTIVGKIGVVKSSLDPRGSVQVGSELWTAISTQGDSIDEGESVTVLSIDGLNVIVSKVDKQSTHKER